MARPRSAAPARRSYLFGLVRGVLIAEFLLLASWNSTGYSYIGWLNHAAEFTALMAVAGIALLIAHIVLLRVAFLALNLIGIAAAMLVIGAVLLAGSTLGLLNLTSLAGTSYFWIFLVACVLSIGINWPKLQSRLSGERSVLKSPP